WGIVAADSINKLYVLCEDLEEIYPIDCRDKIVVDIGGYIGETALFFLHRGASHVHVYEPIFTHLVELNLRINDVGDRVTVHPYGIWWKGGTLGIKEEGTGSGLRCGDKEIYVIPLEEALKQADIVKIDCEGCEYSLLMTLGT
ncbi:MAG: FkbM family methyltransferase, partial [Thermoproteota archaeon]